MSICVCVCVCLSMNPLYKKKTTSSLTRIIIAFDQKPLWIRRGIEYLVIGRLENLDE